MITLILEPWATEYPIEVGEELEIREQGPESDHTLEIQVEQSHIVVFARVGTTLTAFRNGQQLP